MDLKTSNTGKISLNLKVAVTQSRIFSSKFSTKSMSMKMNDVIRIFSISGTLWNFSILGNIFLRKLLDNLFWSALPIYRCDYNDLQL